MQATIEKVNNGYIVRFVKTQEDGTVSPVEVTVHLNWDSVLEYLKNA
jgi:hypothetical protein